MTQEEIEAKRKEAVDAAFQKIIEDVGFSPPEAWETFTKGKILLRLERMAHWLLPDLEDE